MVIVKYLIWKFDMLVYRVFYWRWAKRIRQSPELAAFFVEWSNRYSSVHKPVAASVQLKISKLLDSYEAKWTTNQAS